MHNKYRWMRTKLAPSKHSSFAQDGRLHKRPILRRARLESSQFSLGLVVARSYSYSRFSRLHFCLQFLVSLSKRRGRSTRLRGLVIVTCRYTNTRCQRANMECYRNSNFNFCIMCFCEFLNFMLASFCVVSKFYFKTVNLLKSSAIMLRAKTRFFG